MPETSFARWMETLYGLLTEGGILVFSTHDASLMPPGLALSSGICFIACSESRTLDTNQYGSNYVNEDFVTRVVDGVTAGKRSSTVFPAAWSATRISTSWPRD